MFLATMAIGNALQPADRAVTGKSAGHDFLAFYTAGTFVRTGRTADLYDLPKVREFEQQLVRSEGLELKPDDFGPYWNPPFFALVFAPLSALPYATATTVWIGFNLLCFGGAMVILCRIVANQDADWRTWALVPLLTITSMPFIRTLGHAQNTCLSLLLLSATIALWRSHRPLAAGIVAGMLFYKPQLGAIVAGVLILSMGWRALAGLAITGIMLLLTTLLTLPGTLSTFLQQLPKNVAYMQVEHRYMWDRHITLKAFWRLLLQGFEIGDLTPLTRRLYLLSIALLAGGLAVVIFKLRRDENPISRDRLIAITITAMPLLMPFYFDYDLLLLSAAGVLVAREQLATGRIDHRLVAAWAVLYAWLMINPPVASAVHFNGAAALLTLISFMMIARAIKRSASKEIILPSEPLRQAA